MTEKKFAREIIGMLEVNCYLVPVQKSETLYIIDTGSEPDKILKRAKDFSFKKAVILLTHAHVDHIGATAAVKKELNVETVLLHPDDVGLYKSPDNHLMPFVPLSKDLPETSWNYQTDDFEIIHTPGHTKGGVCYYFKDIPALFTGDTLFCDSIGRTDFPGGSLPQLLDSIKTKIFALPDDLEIYPGHGPSTSVGGEKADNQFVC